MQQAVLLFHIHTWKSIMRRYVHTILLHGHFYSGVPTHPGKSWIFSWIFQVLESPGNESLRSRKVLENEDPG